MDAVQVLIARLLTERWLPREDMLVRRAIVDDAFRQELDRCLTQAGLRLLDNPHAAHVAVALSREAEEPVFGAGERWESNNLGIPRDGIALLVVLWALLILPKRERQISRQDRDRPPQDDMFGAEKPIPRGEQVAGSIAESTLLADFGPKLGGKVRIQFNLAVLSRLGFIQRRDKMISEGPLLDLAIDYGTMAPRVLEGALAELLAARAAPAARSE